MQNIIATILHRQMLTEHVMEFSVSMQTPITIQPGQWILFLLEDDQGPFQRSYSIVDVVTQEDSTLLTFVVKLSMYGRGSSIFRKIRLGDCLIIGGTFGTFSLQDTPFPKVFIGVGMGILPLIPMAKHCMTQKRLFFCVPNKKELFYEQKIKQIPGLRSAMYITQEHVPGYLSGDIDFLAHNFAPTTEFYLSGEAEKINNIVEKLSLLGYKRVYTETY